ncbi:MAG: tetratricopeptide repeat protein [Ignavibacteriales bacterium]|nr:tetratricopeptide repeat protein [Ignavibacteriales bacterium]
MRKIYRAANYRFVIRKVFQNLFFRLNICLLYFLFIYCPNSYSQSLSAEKIYEKVSKAVVIIHAYDYNDSLTKQGSGVVLNDKGYVVTNYHVLSGCERLEILHGKEIIPYVDIIGIDVEKDILILKIKEKKFPAVKIGDTKTLKIGQRIYAIGSPMGLENTISEGIISGLRSYEEINRNFIQITASISHGSSGGAVLNDKGELIGISTLTVKEGKNINFAIPIDEILTVEISSYKKNDEYKDFKLFEKGFNARKRGDNDEALKYFSLFIEKYPNASKAYFNRGNTRSDLEDYRGAIQDYNKAIEFSPNLAESFINRGIAKYMLEDPKGAIQDYNKGIELNPNLTEAYDNRGLAKAKLDDLRGAIQDFNRAILLNPNHTGAYNNRGLAKAKLEDFRGAIQDYNKAIELNPNLAEAYNNRGTAKGKIEDDRGAIQDFNKAILLNPNHVGAYINRGLAKYLLGDETGACLDWSKAGELGSSGAYELIKKYCN